MRTVSKGIAALLAFYAIAFGGPLRQVDLPDCRWLLLLLSGVPRALRV